MKKIALLLGVFLCASAECQEWPVTKSVDGEILIPEKLARSAIWDPESEAYVELWVPYPGARWVKAEVEAEKIAAKSEPGGNGFPCVEEYERAECRGCEIDEAHGICRHSWDDERITHNPDNDRDVYSHDVELCVVDYYACVDGTRCEVLDCQTWEIGYVQTFNNDQGVTGYAYHPLGLGGSFQRIGTCESNTASCPTN
jgi:hypothetical protein